MQEHIDKVVEIVVPRKSSIEDAIKSAVSRAYETVRHQRWFESRPAAISKTEGKNQVA